MKKSFSKSLTILLVLSMGIILSALPSCKSTSLMPVMQQSDTISNIQKNAKVDTILLRDSIYIRESIRGDTVYLTHTEYRDRWRIREVHDTVRVTEYRDRIIEHPPERYVPKFYKWCTIALWAIGLLAIGYGLLRWWLKRKWLHVGG